MESLVSGALGSPLTTYRLSPGSPLHCLMHELSSRAADAIYNAILDSREGGVGDWGGLLLSKYVRCIASTLSIGPGVGILVRTNFEKAEHAVNLLCVEKVDDLERFYDGGAEGKVGLGDDRAEIMKRRKDWVQ